MHALTTGTDETEHMDVKKVLLLAAAAVLIYTLIAHPSTLADGVQTIVGFLVGGIESVVTFLRDSLSGINDELS